MMIDYIDLTMTDDEPEDKIGVFINKMSYINSHIPGLTRMIQSFLPPAIEVDQMLHAERVDDFVVTYGVNQVMYGATWVMNVMPANYKDIERTSADSFYFYLSLRTELLTPENFDPEPETYSINGVIKEYLDDQSAKVPDASWIDFTIVPFLKDGCNTQVKRLVRSQQGYLGLIAGLCIDWVVVLEMNSDLSSSLYQLKCDINTGDPFYQDNTDEYNDGMAEFLHLPPF